MWEDITAWLEQYSGIEYDFDFYLRQLKDDGIFIAPVQWRNNVSIVLDKLSEMVDDIEDKKHEVPDDLPSAPEIKKIVTSNILSSLIDIIDSIKQKLNIEPTIIRRFTTLEKHIDALFDLVKALAEHSMEWLIQKEWFDEYEDNNDDFLHDTFGIVKNDLPNMHFTVNDIIQLHEDDED